MIDGREICFNIWDSVCPQVSLDLEDPASKMTTGRRPTQIKVEKILIKQKKS